MSNAIYDPTLFLIFAFIIQKDILYSMNKHIRPKWLGSMRMKAQTVHLSPDPRQQLRVTLIHMASRDLHSVGAEGPPWD